MKQILFVLFAIASFVAVKASDWANLARYSEHNKYVIKKDSSCRKVVLMGNSITDNWASMDTAFFIRNGFIGRGISGQVSAQMKERFNDDVVALAPEKVVLLCGTNDIAENDGAYNEDKTFGNIVAMVEAAKNNGITPYLSTVLPVYVYPWNRAITDVPQKIASLNRKIRKYAEDNGITIVDYYSKMVAEDGFSLCEKYCFDGVHPNLTGYFVMEKILLDALK